MTISDEELYRLAVDAGPFSIEQVGDRCYKTDAIEALRQAVLQRFKPREPRVVERYVVIVAPAAFPPSVYTICASEDEARKLMKTSIKNTYLAKAIITEVMDSDPKPTESE